MAGVALAGLDCGVDLCGVESVDDVLQCDLAGGFESGVVDRWVGESDCFNGNLEEAGWFVVLGEKAVAETRNGLDGIEIEIIPRLKVANVPPTVSVDANAG